MQKEVKASQAIAISLALLCGVLIFNANLLVLIAGQIATANNQNMAIVTALTNGTIPLCLFGSYFIYKEKLTAAQFWGSLICLAGIIILALSVKGGEAELNTLSVQK